MSQQSLHPGDRCQLARIGVRAVPTGPRALRAGLWVQSITVVALYAFAMQAILGGMLRIGFDMQLHQLCMQGPDVAGDEPAKPPFAHHYLSCCTTAHVHPVLGVPNQLGTTFAWPLRHAIKVARRPEIVSVPRAPPRHQAAARAPPVG